MTNQLQHAAIFNVAKMATNLKQKSTFDKRTDTGMITKNLLAQKYIRPILSPVDLMLTKI